MTTTASGRHERAGAGPNAGHNIRIGIAFMIITMIVFSVQDGITRLLAAHYPPIMIVMVRYWAFALFVTALSSRQPGGLKTVARTSHPLLQMTRGVMLAFQICMVTFSFDRLGLGETHAIMAICPLLIAAGGAIFLGERITISQWLAIGAGFCGVVVLVAPGDGVFDPVALIPLLCAVMFAAYGVLTRYVGRHDPPGTSFFYTGMGGAIGMTLVGPMFWTPMASEHWLWMAALCVTGATGHFLLIKAYEVAEAGSLQPFAYLQLALTSLIGVVIFGEVVDARFLIGAGVIVAAGLLAYASVRRSSVT